MDEKKKKNKTKKNTKMCKDKEIKTKKKKQQKIVKNIPFVTSTPANIAAVSEIPGNLNTNKN